MQYFLIGLAALLLVLLALRGFTRADAGAMARQIRIVTGVVALAAAAALMLRGLMSWALPVAAFGAWALWGGGGAPLGGGGGKSPGQTSRVLTDPLEMELDHDTGAMRGRVLKGAFAGRGIETMSPAEMAMLWQDCRFADLQSAHIIEAYLDRARPSWREDMERAQRGPQPAAGAPMSRAEAYDVLGLRQGAGEDEIRRAHRDLMLKLHPDRGGSDYLAARINLAKDVLLGR